MSGPYKKATLSADGVYRYTLTRRSLAVDRVEQRGGYAPDVLFIMLNPSTADAAVDDPTVRKCWTFAQAIGADIMEIVNLYAYRATSPRDLFAAHKAGVDIVGPDNAEHLSAMVAWCDRVICAWGNPQWPKHGRAMHVARVKDVLELINAIPDKIPESLGVAPGGYPPHPLYLPNSTRPEFYPGPKASP